MFKQERKYEWKNVTEVTFISLLGFAKFKLAWTVQNASQSSSVVADMFLTLILKYVIISKKYENRI